MSWWVAAPVLFAACYPGVDNSDCEILCGKDEACPSNLSCVGRYCVAEGQVCTDDALAAAYSFEELASGLALDSSGNGNTAVFNGTPNIVDGAHGNGFAFGDNEFAVVAHTPSLELVTNQLTIEMWVDLVDEVGEGDDVLIAKLWMNGEQGNPFYEWGIEWDDLEMNRVELYLADVEERVHGPFTISPPLGRLTHIAFTYDGSEVSGYVDGVRQDVNNSNLEIEIAHRGQNLMIGADGNESQRFRGVMDEVRIYRRALGEGEINADMMTAVKP